MSNTWDELGSPNNYTIGGLRLFFNELVGSQYQGYLYLGNIVTGGFNLSPDILEHFSAKSGTRLKDRRLVRQANMTFTCTLDEPNPIAMNMFMLGAGVSDVAAVTGGTVVDEPSVIHTRDAFYLRWQNPTSIVVKKGATTLVLDTDYTVGNFQGYATIKRKSASTAVLEGDAVTVSYSYTRPVLRTFKPMTRVLRTGKAIIMGVSDVGQEFEHEIQYCQLTPNGDFSYNDNDWTQFQLTLDILDNTTADSATPFGQIYHHGAGANL
jgi:hypothetical protein